MEGREEEREWCTAIQQLLLHLMYCSVISASVIAFYLTGVLIIIIIMSHMLSMTHHDAIYDLDKHKTEC